MLQALNPVVVIYKKLEQTFKDEFLTSASVNSYIIDTLWLQAWKRIYGYDGQEKSQEYLPSINENICMILQPSTVYWWKSKEAKMWNIKFQEGLVEGKDYQIISHKMWKLLVRTWSEQRRIDCQSTLPQDIYFEIQLDSHITPEMRKVTNVYPMKVTVCRISCAKDEFYHLPKCEKKEYQEEKLKAQMETSRRRI